MAASLSSPSLAIAAISALPHVSRGLLIRGGAVAAAALSSSLSSIDVQTALTDESPSTATALSISGGETSADDGNISLFGLTITPEARATLAMVRQKYRTDQAWLLMSAVVLVMSSHALVRRQAQSIDIFLHELFEDSKNWKQVAVHCVSLSFYLPLAYQSKQT